MKYKVVILDIDGTLVDSQKELPQPNRDAVIRAQEKGVKVVLATGRPTYGVMPIARQLRLQDFGGYVISYNGGTIWDLTSDKPLFEMELPQELLPELYDVAKANGVQLISYHNEVILAESTDDEYIRKESFLNKMEIRAVESVLDALPVTVPKCLIVGHVPILERLERELFAKVDGAISVYRSEPYFLELVPPGIDKAASIDRLMNTLGVEAHEVIACGDGFNDLSMIQWAGMGVAMANAQEVVREAAQYIAPSNDDNGVAHILERFILNG